MEIISGILGGIFEAIFQGIFKSKKVSKIIKLLIITILWWPIIILALLGVEVGFYNYGIPGALIAIALAIILILFWIYFCFNIMKNKNLKSKF